MKKVLLATVALLACSSMAMAAGSATLSVSANIVGTCGFTTSTANLAFGTPTGAADATANASLNFACTNGVNYTITDNAAANPLSGPGTIPFALSYTAAGVGTGAAVALPITGTILQADVLSAPVGVYASTVTMTINP